MSTYGSVSGLEGGHVASSLVHVLSRQIDQLAKKAAAIPIVSWLRISMHCCVSANMLYVQPVDLIWSYTYSAANSTSNRSHAVVFVV